MTPLRVDLIDLENSPGQTCSITLADVTGNTRKYSCLEAFTSEVPATVPGFSTLDLTVDTPQTGYLSTATAVTDPEYDGNSVVRIVFSFEGAGAYDNLCFCPWVPSRIL